MKIFGWKNLHWITLLTFIHLQKGAYNLSVNHIDYIPPTPSVNEFQGGIFVCPSVCADSWPAPNFSLVWHWLSIFDTLVYHHETMCRVHSWSRYDLELSPEGQIYRVFDMFSCPAHNLFLDWLWHAISGTWVYHHERMCQVHSWSWYDLELWPQGKIYRVYDMALCSGLTFFVLWQIHTLFDTWVYHHGTMCRVHLWTLYDLGLWPQYQYYIFTMNLSLAKCLCSLT